MLKKALVWPFWGLVLGLFLVAFLSRAGSKPAVGQSSRRVNAPATSQTQPQGQRVIDLRHTVLPQIGEPSAPMEYQSDTFKERTEELLPEERVGIAIYENRNRSIVNVDTVTVRQGAFYTTQEAEGLGSGIVLSKDGVILTNYHVVEEADSVTVTLFDGQSYSADVVGQDPSTDIALLKIAAPAETLFPVEFGDSSRLLVGQTVFAIGNPFGYERTMTRGIVSNLNRTIESPKQFRMIKGVIQIDAAINVGNSGGALFDSRGRMIGMNTAIASRVGENTGVGFAIPVNTISRIAGVLLEAGEVVRGDIGIVQVNETETGVIPVQIEDGGAADKAGLRGGKIVVSVVRHQGVEYRGHKKVVPKEGFDLIVGVSGQRIHSGEDFITAVEEHKPGETIELDIIRRGEPMKLPVVLD